MTLFVIEAGKCHDDCFFHSLQKKDSKGFVPANSFQIIIEKT
jgi:hypothetical protein